MTTKIKVLRAVAIILGAVLVLYIGRIFLHVLIAGIVAGILYYISEPIVSMLERWRLPRLAAVLMVFVIFAAIVVFLIVYMVPVIAEQLISLAQDVPFVFAQLEEWFQTIETRFGPEIGEQQLQDLVDRAAATVTDFLETAVATIIDALANVLAVIVVVVAGIVIAFYLLQDHERLRNYIFLYIPNESRRVAGEIFNGSNKVLSGFLKGRVIVGIIVGTVVGIVLLILGVPYAFILGVITAIFELIPYIGPILAAIPAILIALTVSPTTAIIVAILFFVIQQLESVVLSPRIVGAHVRLHPITVIIAVLVGGEVLGIVGVFAAIPLAGIAKVFAEQFLLDPEEREESIKQSEGGDEDGHEEEDD